MSNCSKSFVTLESLTKNDLDKPHYAPPPCQVACPVGTDVGSYVGYIWDGKLAEALEAITATNPFSSVCGRVCDAPCEPACRRANSDGAVQIRALKRYVMDRLGPNFKLPQVPVSRAQSVAIVGAGPAGLTAAQDLAAAGLTVHVYEAAAKPGGMLMWGIPEFRLPHSVVEQDIARVVERFPGLHMHLSSPLGEAVTLAELADKHDAVLLSIGASAGKTLGVPGDDRPQVMDGVSFLSRVNGGERPILPETVVIVGGGDVAMDACRAAKRLPGVKSVKVLYRRGPAEIPARAHELKAALAEGVEIIYNTAPTAVVDTDKGMALRCVRTELGAPDADGRRRPVTVAGSEHDVACGLVIAAVGQKTVSLELAKHGLMKNDIIDVDPATLATRMPKVYAAGDSATGPSTIVQAMYSGHKAAYYVLAALDGVAHPAPYRTPWRTREVPVAQDPLWEKLPPKTEPFLGLNKEAPFAEAEAGYDDVLAHEQAARCYRCDTETGSSDYTVKMREQIFAMARAGSDNIKEIGRITAERLTPRANPFPPARQPTFDDLTFLPANLTRLVIDPYREACVTRTDLGEGLKLDQPVIVGGFEAAPAAIRDAVAEAAMTAGGASFGREAIGDLPWLQLVEPGAKGDAKAVAVIHAVGAHFAPVALERAHPGQLLGLAVSSPAVEQAVDFALAQKLDILVLDGSGQIAAPWGELAGPPDLTVLKKAIARLRHHNAEESVTLIYYGAIRSGSDVAKALALGAHAAIASVAVAIAAGGAVAHQRMDFPEGLSGTERRDAVANFLKACASETSMMARCTGKTNIHNLEPEDMRSLTLAAETATGIPMAGVNRKAG